MKNQMLVHGLPLLYARMTVTYNVLEPEFVSVLETDRATLLAAVALAGPAPALKFR